MRSWRYLFFRVLAGLLIGIGMFYFRQANAQTCAVGETEQYTVTSNFVPDSGWPASVAFDTCYHAISTGSFSAALSQLVGCQTGAYNTPNSIVVNDSATPGSPSSLIYHRSPISGAALNSSSYYINKSCIAQPQCTEHAEGTKQRFGGAGTLQTSVCSGSCRFDLDQSKETQDCHPAANGIGVICTGQVMAIAVGGPDPHWDGNFVSTGDYCDQTAEPQPPKVAAENEPICQTVQGVEVCTGGQTPKHCIKIMGQLSCISDAGDVCTTPECQAAAAALKNPDNSATARANAVTPPAPNTGTPGNRAPPSLELFAKKPSGTQGNVHGGGTDQLHWWTPAAVAASDSSDGSIGEDQGNDDCEQNPEAEGCEDEDDDDPPDDECDPETENCNGADGDVPELGDVQSFGESLDNVKGAFGNSPLAVSVRSLQIPAGGSCPTATINIPYFHESYTMDSYCQLAATIRTPLRLAFLAFWLIVAVMLFLRP